MSKPNKRIKIDQSNEERKVAEKQEVTIQGPNYLLDLNADALIAIFERMDVMDFPSVAQLSDNMKEIIFNTFRRKYKNLKLDFSFYASGNFLGNFMSVRDRNRRIRLFETFGSLINELEVKFECWCHDPNEALIIDSIVEHCMSLKTFRLNSYQVPDDQFSLIRMGRMGQLFSRLEKLYLNNFWNFLITHPGTKFNGCASLVELELCESYAFCQPMIRSTFPKLETFIVKDRGNWQYNDMDAFIIRHPKLKTLSMDCNVNEIPMAAANLPNLEMFGFRFVYKKMELLRVENLAKFRNLKELACFAVGQERQVSQLLKVLPAFSNSLEVLDLRHGCGNQNFIQIVNSLKELKAVRLQDIRINGTSTDDLKNSLRATVIIE